MILLSAGQSFGLTDGKAPMAINGVIDLRGQSLDEKIVQEKSIQKPLQGIVFEASDEQYVLARQNYGRINAEGKYTPVPVLLAGDGKYYRLPNPFMFKEYISDVENLLHQERHPLLVETAERAKSTTEFYAGNVEYQVKTYNDLESIDLIENWIYVK